MLVNELDTMGYYVLLCFFYFSFKYHNYQPLTLTDPARCVSNKLDLSKFFTIFMFKLKSARCKLSTKASSGETLVS